MVNLSEELMRGGVVPEPRRGLVSLETAFGMIG